MAIVANNVVSHKILIIRTFEQHHATQPSVFHALPRVVVYNNLAGIVTNTRCYDALPHNAVILLLLIAARVPRPPPHYTALSLAQLCHLPAGLAVVALPKRPQGVDATQSAP